ncbi:hypothetical protein ACFP81_09695 [Deinococcus lacus]|uniref:FlgD Ig-like domain-containing protein n=1 Tax=Deinococcus lacus TaxID=392561 RepID=A0ABW1YD69_9DEIO
MMIPTGGQGERLSVPYGGFVGDYQALEVFGNVTMTVDGKEVVKPFPALYDALEDRIYFRDEPVEKLPSFSFLAYPRVIGNRSLEIMDYPTVWVNFAHQAQRVVFEAVDEKDVAHEITTQYYVGRTGKSVYTPGSSSQPWASYVWDGKYKDGSDAPAGKYVLRVRVLKALGDESIQSHSEVYVSQPFMVERGKTSIDLD